MRTVPVFVYSPFYEIEKGSSDLNKVIPLKREKRSGDDPLTIVVQLDRLPGGIRVIDFHRAKVNQKGKMLAAGAAGVI